MSSCSTIDPLVTPYIDDELAAADRQTVESHMRRCAPCRTRLESERAVRELVGARKRELHSQCAPASLRARCSQACRADAIRESGPAVASWRARLMPLAMAASLVLVVGAAFVYPLTASSSRVLAAELAVDHVKCFMLNGALGTHHSADTVERTLAASFGWPADLPDRPEQAGLELVGERTCLYGEGRI